MKRVVVRTIVVLAWQPHQAPHLSCLRGKGDHDGSANPAFCSTNACVYNCGTSTPTLHNSVPLHNATTSSHPSSSFSAQQVSTGLAAKGYKLIALDEGWAAHDRSPDGKMLTDTTKFPWVIQRDGWPREGGHSLAICSPRGYQWEQMLLIPHPGWGWACLTTLPL